MKRGINMFMRITAIVVAVILLLAIGGGLYFRFTSPHFFRVARGVKQRVITTKLADLAGVVFVQGMQGVENLYLEPKTLRLYATDLHGSVYLVDGQTRADLKIVTSRKIGGFALGIDRGADGQLYVAVSPYDNNPEWITRGGAVYRLDPELTTPVKLTEEYPGINGLACADDGRCYFASSNFDFLHPHGQVYVMPISPGNALVTPKVALVDLGLANGLRYDQRTQRLYVADTLEQVVALAPKSSTSDVIYQKTKYREAFDDVCLDRQGNLWMTDPVGVAIKKYDPQTKAVTRFIIEGLGQTSACRIRDEQGAEVIYITEIKNPTTSKSAGFDGRGVVSVPVTSLLQKL